MATSVTAGEAARRGGAIRDKEGGGATGVASLAVACAETAVAETCAEPLSMVGRVKRLAIGRAACSGRSTAAVRCEGVLIQAAVLPG